MTSDLRSEPRSSGKGALPARDRQPVLILAAVCAAAITLRLVVFTSRGDYVAFDEGWYLLLGRSVFDGDGFRLSGLQHTTLSPLFPLLAGAMGLITNSAVWGGRIVAAVCAGLLVWPCWFIFRRLAGARVAWAGCVLIAVMPSLAPFAAPYWIGWDLWVGAEPILHLLLFAAVALTLRARDKDRTRDWAFGGVAFALAYLARPEAIIPFAILGGALGVLALLGRRQRTIVHALVMAVAFGITASPYWIYLHDATGRWTLTGRYVELPAGNAGAAGDEVNESGRGLTGVEAMLWRNDNRQYVRELYGLDASGTRLRSTYWGIPEPVPDSTPAPAGVENVSHDPGGSAAMRRETGANDATSGAAYDPVATTAGVSDAVSPESASALSQQTPAPRQPTRLELYARALGAVVPWFVWLPALLGIFGRRRRLLEELLVVLPLVVTSILVARIVGADPRTQLFMVPLAAFYAARGIWLVSDIIEARRSTTGLRRNFVGIMGTAVLAVVLASTLAYWTWMGWTMGSPHHTTGAANRQVASQLRAVVPESEPVMSWHPAVALFADRDWRVLPFAPLSQIVSYGNAIATRHVVLSRYYPGSKLIEQLDRDHLVLQVPPQAAGAAGWWIDIEQDDGTNTTGSLRFQTSGVMP